MDRKLLDRACNSMRRRNGKEMEDAMKKRGSVGVHTMSAMLEKHSGISAAPTVQRARLDRRWVRLAHFTCHHCAPIAFTYAFNFYSIIPSTRSYEPLSLSLPPVLLFRYHYMTAKLITLLKFVVKATIINVIRVLQPVFRIFKGCKYVSRYRKNGILVSRSSVLS